MNIETLLDCGVYSTPPVSHINRAYIYKPFMEPRNRFPAWRNRFLSRDVPMFGKGHPGWGQENREPFLQRTALILYPPWYADTSLYTQNSSPETLHIRT